MENDGNFPILRKTTQANAGWRSFSTEIKTIAHSVVTTSLLQEDISLLNTATDLINDGHQYEQPLLANEIESTHLR